MIRIAIEGLSKTFPRQPAPVLRDLSLVVDRGELVALLGPSGSGKSTLLNIIAGIETADRGTVRFDEQPMLAVPAERRGAVLLFQKPYLFPFLNVADNVAFGLRARGTKGAVAPTVARMLDLVGLPGIERKLPAQLSGGEQQRVALARALVIAPRVLLLDEPLSSLDTEIRLALQLVIRRVQRELGITTLLVTHDLSEAVTLADRTALLLGGRIVACDRPQQLFERPPTAAAARFMGITTLLRGRAAGHHFQAPWGPLRLASATSQDELTVAIRPEHLRLAAGPGLNTVPGTVAETIYKGEFTEYHVALGAITVQVKVFRPPAHSPGDVVYVAFPPDHLFAVRDEE